MVAHGDPFLILEISEDLDVRILYETYCFCKVLYASYELGPTPVSFAS